MGATHEEADHQCLGARRYARKRTLDALTRESARALPPANHIRNHLGIHVFLHLFKSALLLCQQKAA